MCLFDIQKAHVLRVRCDKNGLVLTIFHSSCHSPTVSFRGRYLEKDEGFGVSAWASKPQRTRPLTTFSFGDHCLSTRAGTGPRPTRNKYLALKAILGRNSTDSVLSEMYWARGPRPVRPPPRFPTPPPRFPAPPPRFRAPPTPTRPPTCCLVQPPPSS